ncbi:MAG TPA: oligosaccharide flippase family protein, partial [Capillimicrobium sp.]|nr:oligosaccharide flippase family protein [Capillimicrobium sp.]
MSTLRRLALRGGAVLSVREAAGVVIRLAGVLLVTRLIGPADFGIYAGAAAVVTVLAVAAQLGAELYLIRREAEPSPATYDEVFSVLAVTTVVATALALAGSLVAGALGVGSRYLDPFRVLALTIPVNVLWAPAQAKLERAFRYGRMAVVEVGGDLALYGVAVPLAAAGAGVWAPVAGYAAWQTWLLAAGCALAGYRPRWRWSAPQARELLRYGLEYAPVPLLTRAELLVNPLVVGPVLGAASVGYVALVIRLVETLSFVMRATWRLSVVALARVQSDRRRLARGLEESMAVQVLGVAPVLAAFAILAPWLVPLLFGDAWSPAVDLYPYVAAGAVLLAVVNAHYAVLYVLGRQVLLARISLVRL